MTIDVSVTPAQTEESAAPTTRERTTSALLLEAAKTEDPAARRQLIDEVVVLNMGPARRIAQRYANRGVSLDDLTQVA